MEVITDTLTIVGVTAAGAALGGPLGAAGAVAITYPLVDNSNSAELIEDLVEDRTIVNPYGDLWDKFYNLAVVLIVLLLLLNSKKVLRGCKPMLRRYLE